MSERPLHKQASDFVRIWMRDKRDAELGLTGPVSHSGPNKGPLDWYISMGMLGGFWGLLKDGTVGGLIGAVIGVGIVGVWNLFWHLVKLLLIAIFRWGDDTSKRPRRPAVHEDPDIAAYFRRKKKEK